MDIISFNEAATANGRIESFIENPDSTSGIVTVPKVIASGETITIPAGRVAILPNVQIDGVLNVENGGEVFIPSGSTLSTVVEKVTSTDNAIVRFDGTTGAVQNSSVIIDDIGNVGIGTGLNINAKLDVTGSIRQYNNGAAANSVINMVNDSKNWYAGLRGDSSNSYTIADETRHRLILDAVGNTLHISPNGGLGYGIGSSGAVTQLTSKSTAVTLNKPSGRIVTHNTSLAAGATVVFQVNNSLILTTDTINAILVDNANYDVRHGWNTNGAFTLKITNTTGSPLSEVVNIHFIIIKGAIS